MLKKNKCFKKFLKNRSVLNKGNFNKKIHTIAPYKKKNRVIFDKHLRN